MVITIHSNSKNSVYAVFVFRFLGIDKIYISWLDSRVWERLTIQSLSVCSVAMILLSFFCIFLMSFPGEVELPMEVSNGKLMIGLCSMLLTLVLLWPADVPGCSVGFRGGASTVPLSRFPSGSIALRSAGCWRFLWRLVLVPLQQLHFWLYARCPPI